jgi:predicted Zn-ribbon and HTH transcriptional regulator
MIRRVRCSKCGWSGDELDALYRGMLRCPYCETPTIPDPRSRMQRWAEALLNWWTGAAR